jgi:FkbM family methyltransferase
LPHLADRLKLEFPAVCVHSCAVSDRTGEQIFQFVVDDPPFSGLTRRKYRRDDMEVRPITVPVRRLDDLIPANATIRVIKADIEGGEYHAFQGARQILERSRPYLIFEFGLGGAEYFSVTSAMMYTLLHDEFGYNVSTMTRWLTGQPALSAGEFSESFAKGTDEYFLAYPKPVA